VLKYTGDRRVSINKQEITLQELDTRLKEVYENRRDKTMFIMAAGSLRYGDDSTFWGPGDSAASTLGGGAQLR
jgi:biopolymer transport protein ExbD